jgi:hypothetical protein
VDSIGSWFFTAVLMITSPSNQIMKFHDYSEQLEGVASQMRVRTVSRRMGWVGSKGVPREVGPFCLPTPQQMSVAYIFTL